MREERSKEEGLKSPRNPTAVRGAKKRNINITIYTERKLTLYFARVYSLGFTKYPLVKSDTCREKF